MQNENIKGREKTIQLMKIICLNIIGELINKEEVGVVFLQETKLINKEEVGVVFLQETKLEIDNKERCYNIRNNDTEWEHFVVVNGVHEILIKWHKNTFICDMLGIKPGSIGLG